MSTWLVEHKTTSEDITPGGIYWRKLRLDIQAGAYLYAKPEAEGIIYDVLRKPAQRPKQGETPEEFGLRVLSAINADPGRYLQRAKVTRLEWQKLALVEDLRSTRDQIDRARHLEQYPHNSDACFTWNRACDYLPVCCGEAQLDDEALYVDKPGHSELTAFEESEGVVTLTQSSMRTWRACPRKYQYRYVAGRVARGEAAATLTKGLGIHAALEQFFLGKEIDECLTAIPKDDIYEYAHSAAMFAAYVQHWGRPKNVKGVEVEFSVMSGGSGLNMLRGKVDAIVELEDT